MKHLQFAAIITSGSHNIVNPSLTLSQRLHTLTNFLVDNDSFVNLHQLIQTLFTSKHVFVNMEEGIREI